MKKVNWYFVFTLLGLILFWSGLLYLTARTHNPTSPIVLDSRVFYH